MINLIPDNIRVNSRYSARNIRLLRYTAVSLLTMVAIVVITGLSILEMNRTEANLQRQSEKGNQRIESYKSLQTKGQQLSDQIATINALLEKQVSFSSLLPQIAQIMPPGAVLKQLDLSTKDILPSTGGTAVPGAGASSATQQKPFVISAAVKERSIAATLLENIKANKNLFVDADIVSVNLATSTSTEPNALPSITSRYPYQVVINAYLKKITPQSITPSAKGGSQ
jgi:Tfp pilus assembly protein PilN